MKNTIYFLALVISGFTLNQSCSTDFDVYAPEKEIRVVYGVLNPRDTVQYIRIAKAFQFKGDAFAYAAANDLSVKNLQVSLKGNGITYTATQVDDAPKESGVFFERTTLYKFRTDGMGSGAEKLVPGQTYTLEIGMPDDEHYLTATTTIPEVPRIGPQLDIKSGGGQSRCLPEVDLENKYIFEFRTADFAKAYEVRMYFNYEKNGIAQQAVWGPSSLFEGNRNCNPQSGSRYTCYGFAAKEIIGFLKTKMPDDGSVYTYNTTDSCVATIQDTASLPKSLKLQVNAVDEFLSNYMSITDPSVTDLSGTRPQYTNLRGNIDAIGVFGSYNSDFRFAILSPCTEYLLELNGRTKPSPSCE